jgi:hypothetical protein
MTREDALKRVRRLLVIDFLDDPDCPDLSAAEEVLDQMLITMLELSKTENRAVTFDQLARLAAHDVAARSRA